MNQFAIDRTGLTMTLLAPLETRDLLRGKAIGNALVAAIPTGICFIAAFVLFPAGNAALWLSVPLTLAASYLLLAPVAAVLSAIFPRAVDLNSIGRGSNAHSAAGLLGTLAFVISGGPCLLLVLLATTILERPVLAPLFLLVWLLICAGVSLLLFSAAAALFERRRENLGLIV
jgi:beta-lactamase regulating signal transducer with metallopeptidase domain